MRRNDNNRRRDGGNPPYPQRYTGLVGYRLRVTHALHLQRLRAASTARARLNQQVDNAPPCLSHRLSHTLLTPPAPAMSARPSSNPPITEIEDGLFIGDIESSHWVEMGVLRSANALIAHLMRTHQWSVDSALAFVKEKRKIRLNSNFKEQLVVWGEVGYEI
ncbi:hypothetical protein B0T19DRAFT_413951 [Cercophora scortea]|uniref:Dual specificity phosphatase catalytic domain-containing protein n=1 Tax=Cercophora scortea TaxID=314031 RepID=A0AAE0MI13_9PEZI|nr:hypothetical protein B0T19DRAFT_413951 [Cercophora scortea]